MCYLYDGNEPILDKLMRYKEHKQDFVLPETYRNTTKQRVTKVVWKSQKRWDKNSLPLKPGQILRFSPTQKDEMVGTALLKNNLSAKSAHSITEITTLTSIHLKNYTEKLVLQTRYTRNTMHTSGNLVFYSGST